MKNLITYIAARTRQDPDTPQIVKDAMNRMADKFSRPPVPSMTKEEFEALPKINKAILSCNMPGCGDVVCTHGMLCLKHHLELNKVA